MRGHNGIQMLLVLGHGAVAVEEHLRPLRAWLRVHGLRHTHSKALGNQLSPCCLVTHDQ